MTSDITACANQECEHARSCYRAQLFREREPGAYICSAYFTRDPQLQRMRGGWDCFWPIREEKRA